MTAYMPKAKTVEWETPQNLFNELNKEFHFNLDVCATSENAKCAQYFTPTQDGLRQQWSGVCWMNPPYGLVIRYWVRKAWEQSRRGVTTVCLLPARTDTKWFHEYCYDYKTNSFKVGVEGRFLKGRLKFGRNGNSATFPSMIIVFRGR